ncbi:ATP-binding protein [Yoonia sp. 208BN28-4]|uniref:ATP-binding protein n=1 Tax=Yoonia sp. 208BN28-4 TaxID=3126505 RepID=UPI0030A30391
MTHPTQSLPFADPPRASVRRLQLLFLPVPILFLAAAFVPVQAIAVGFVLTGLMLAVLAGLLLWNRRTTLQQNALMEQAASHIISNDTSPAFVADEDGNVIYANATANERFDIANIDTIATRFSSLIANPDQILFRLQTHADTHASAREDIVTRAGQYRLSVAQLNTRAFLWRFDDLGIADRTKGRSTAATALPMLTVGSSGAVLYVNDAFRAILGHRPRTLKEAFGHDHIVSGQTYLIEGPSGTSEFFAVEISSPSGRREIYALPASGQAAPTRSLGGEWDAIEDLPVPLLQIAPDGAVLASNREARALLGIKTTDGKHVGDMLDGLGRPMADWLRDALAGQPGQASQFLRGRGDFHDVFVQVTLNTAGTGDDKHLVAVLNDVTELKTLEAQFVQSQKMHAIGQLAGGVAHDFNNLLTAISGHCDLLLLRHDQGDQDYGDLVQIHQNANRAASLVGQLLAFSRKQNLQPEIIDLRDAMSDLTHLLNRLVGEKVKLSVHHHPDLSMIKADRRQLEQVMMNLVVNARDAMPEGGEIRITTENKVLSGPMERDRATVPAGEYVLVTVNDHGCGIPPEIMGQLFEPFVSTKRQGEGTGLGLSTAYGIVKQSGGYIFAESKVGMGTEFLLLFPKCDLPEVVKRPMEASLPKPVIENADGVVLLVEDEAPVRAFASRALRLRGYTVLEADCAETALTMLDDPDLMVDIFVTDVIMPGMDGPTWVREALAKRPDTKVIFVSGYAEDAFSDGNPQIPNSVFLPKPFSLNDLTTTVQQQLH